MSERYGSDNVSSTTIAPSNAKNVKLAGQRHPVTDIVFDNKGFPIFDDVAAFDTRLPIKAFRDADYTNQMKMASRDLAEAIKRGEINASMFNKDQLRQIERGMERVDGYTWHHHQDTGRMQLVPRDIHKKTGHIGWGGYRMGSKVEQFKLIKNNSETIGFVLACLFSSAITKAELCRWALSIVDKMDAESIPSYIFDLIGFNGTLADLYKVIGFAPVWNRSDEEENSLYGISLKRGMDVYDIPIEPQEALDLLKNNPHIMDSFREIFPFIILP